MKDFLIEHPIISLIMLTTICDTAIVITRILTNTPQEPLFVCKIGNKPSGKEDISNK